MGATSGELAPLLQQSASLVMWVLQSHQRQTKVLGQLAFNLK